jgi:hypothetical protein
MAKKSPYLMFQRTLRKNSAYQNPRAISGTICALNVIGSLLVGLRLLFTEGGGAVGIAVLFSALVWILVHAIAQSLFDIADSHLERIHREHLAESRARAAANPE